MKDCPNCLRSTRREALAGLGSWAALAALGRHGEARAQSLDVTPRGSAKACIFVNLDGGPSHLDTFDVKDAAWNPVDADIVQSGPIALGRAYFPKLSDLLGNVTLLRSVSSWEAEHQRGQFYLQTGHPANPAFIQETPHMGAVAALELGGQGKLPPFLSLNGRAGQGSTFLGGRYEPMAAPANQGGFSTIQHCCFGGQGQARFQDRYSLLDELEKPIREAPADPRLASQTAYYAAARDLMYDPTIDSVFRFSNDDNLRYGNNNFGRACLVARNAVAARAGAAFIALRQGGWDTHQNMFDTRYPNNHYQLANTLDAGVGNLIEDLRAGGLLDETLIVVMGEFGRTPGQLNARGGRDHHKNAMSVLMAGGGVRGGRVIGATDDDGDKIVDPGWRGQRAIYIEDILSTVYSALGINWTKRITETPTGRIFEYVPGASRGQYVPVNEVFGS